MKKMKKAFSLLAASALVCCVAAGPALADPVTKTGTSEVTVTKAEAGQISVTIPQQIPLVSSIDGTFLTPDAKYVTITNASNFPVKVAKVQSTVIDPASVNLVAKGASLEQQADGPLNMWMTVGSGSDTLDLSNYTAGKAPSTPDQWVMDSGDGSLSLSVSGAISSNTANEVAGVHALDIVWTVSI